MRIGNTTEREAPFKLGFRFDRLIPPKWKRPYLVWLHALLKLLPLLVWTFGVPGVGYIEKDEGYVMENNREEINVTVFTILALLDFFITKIVLGPKLTGLHHGFKKDEEGKITYHYYAEKDFLSRYASTDRESFFTFLVVSSFIWFWVFIVQLFRLNILRILLASFGFSSVYLNLYLFVLVRYYTQWGMSKFFSTWIYNFFIQTEFMDGDSSDNNFRNTYYDNRARY